MKKVCYIINSDWYFELHWIERALAAKMAGYEVHVICHFEGEDVKSRLEGQGFICHNSEVAAQSYNPLGFIVTFTKIWAMLKKLNPEILHCITIKSTVTGGIYAKVRSRPVVLSFAGLGRVFDHSKGIHNLLRFCTLAVYRYIAKNKKATLVFEHEFDRDTLLSLTGIDINQTLVIDGAGINTEEYPYSTEPGTTLPVVLFASRMLWSKGLGDLITVKKSLEKSDIHFQLNVAGIISSADADAIPLMASGRLYKLARQK
jgi:glycosyltransferase involved in cell wall biosynthesis